MTISVAADAVVLCIPETIDGDPHVLLVKRKYEPFPGMFAFPGGFVEDDETLVAAAVRELQEETGLVLPESEFYQFGVADAVDRDPRSRIVSNIFMAVVAERSEVNGGDDAASAEWVSLADLIIEDEVDAPPDDPEAVIRPGMLAFDHAQILGDMLSSLGKLSFDQMLMRKAAEHID